MGFNGRHSVRADQGSDGKVQKLKRDAAEPEIEIESGRKTPNTS